MKINTLISLLLLSSLFFLNSIISQEPNIKELSNALSNVSEEHHELIILTSKSLLKDNADDLKVLHLTNQFLVSEGDRLTLVKDHNIDTSIRNISSINLKRFLAEYDGYVRIQKDDEGDFHLESFCRLKGGGILGANVGWYVGKFAVYGVSYGALGLVAACTGPGFKVVFPALIKTFAAPIEYASNVAACGTAIASAAATGAV